MHDRRHIIPGVPSPGEHRPNRLQVGDRVQIVREAFAADTAVKVAADPGMAGRPSDLADVVDVGHDIREAHAGVAVPVPPTGLELPASRDGSDDAVPFDDGPNLSIGKLPLMRIQGAAVVVAGVDRAIVSSERVPERLVRAVREIQGDSHTAHLAQERGAELGQSQLASRPARVPSRSEMRRPEQAEVAIPPVAQLRRLEDGVCALHADDEAKRRRARLFTRKPTVPFGPFGHMRVELRRIADDANVALVLQRMIVGQVSARDAVRLHRRGEIQVRLRPSGRPRNDRDKAEGNPTPPHLRERDGALRAPLAGRRGFLRADRIGRAEEIAVPLQRVERQIKMAVDDEHERISPADRFAVP